MELHREGQLAPLTRQEFKMLRFFLNHQNRVVSRIELLNEVWGYNNYPTTRTIDTHMLRLRQKLEKEPDHPVRFQTVHGIGYKFVGCAAHHPATHAPDIATAVAATGPQRILLNDAEFGLGAFLSQTRFDSVTKR